MKALRKGSSEEHANKIYSLCNKYCVKLGAIPMKELTAHCSSRFCCKAQSAKNIKGHDGSVIGFATLGEFVKTIGPSSAEVHLKDLRQPTKR